MRNNLNHAIIKKSFWVFCNKRGNMFLVLKSKPVKTNSVGSRSETMGYMRSTWSSVADRDPALLFVTERCSSFIVPRRRNLKVARSINKVSN